MQTERLIKYENAKIQKIIEKCNYTVRFVCFLYPYFENSLLWIKYIIVIFITPIIRLLLIVIMRLRWIESVDVILFLPNNFKNNSKTSKKSKRTFWWFLESLGNLQKKDIGFFFWVLAFRRNLKIINFHCWEKSEILFLYHEGDLVYVWRFNSLVP